MIQLTIDGQPLDMRPNQQATLQKGAGLLDFEALEPTISTPLSLPDTDRNRKVFGHINIPSSLSEFKRLPAILEHNGSLVAEGEFILQSAEEKQGFEGYFRADAGAVASNKDRLIGDILAEHTFNWDDSVKTDPAYLSPDADISFPQMVWRVTTYNDDVEQALFVNSEEANPERLGRPLAPAFKLRYLLRKLFEKLGYTVKMEANAYLHRQAVLYARDTYKENLGHTGFQQLLPEMTLSAFIRSCRCLGFAIGINTQFQEVEIKSLSEVFSSPSTDWTAQAEPMPKVEPAYGEGESTMEFGLIPEQAPNTAEVDYNNQLSITEVGDVRAVRSEGRYYELVQFGEEGAEYSEWAKADPAIPPAELDREGFSCKCDFIPLPASRVFHFRAKGLRIRNRNGNVVLGGLPRSFRQNYQIRVISPVELGQQWVGEVLPRTNDAQGRVELPISYTQDYDSVEIEYRLTTNKLRPDRTEELEGKPLIGLYHGEQSSLDGNYSYAGPSSLAPRASVAPLADVALSWESLLENDLSTLKSVVEKGKQATFIVRPKPSQLAFFSPLRPVAIEGVRYLVKKLELRLGKRLWAEAEGWVG